MIHTKENILSDKFIRVNESNAWAVINKFNTEIAAHAASHYFNEIQIAYDNFRNNMLSENYQYYRFHFIVDDQNQLSFLLRKTNNQKYNEQYDPNETYYTIENKNLVKKTISSDSELQTLLSTFNTLHSIINNLTGLTNTKCISYHRFSIEIHINNIDDILSQETPENNLKFSFKFGLISNNLSETDCPLGQSAQYLHNRITLIGYLLKDTKHILPVDIGQLEP